MKLGKRFLYSLTLFLMVGLLPSCFFVPEQFEAEVRINKDGTYSLTYEGLLTHIFARAAEVEQGEISAKTRSELREIEEDLRKDSNFEKVEYVGHAQFKVVYKREGTLDRRVHFLGEGAKIVSLVPLSGRKVEIRGIEVIKSDIRELERLGIKGDGTLEVTTGGTVLTHNAESVPWLFGLLGSYRWVFESLRDPAPFMVTQLQ